MSRLINRRTLIVGAGSVALGGCDLISSTDRGQRADTPAGKANVQLGLGPEESFQQAIARPPGQLAHDPQTPAAVPGRAGSGDPGLDQLIKQKEEKRVQDRFGDVLCQATMILEGRSVLCKNGR